MEKLGRRVAAFPDEVSLLFLLLNMDAVRIHHSLCSITNTHIQIKTTIPSLSRFQSFNPNLGTRCRDFTIRRSDFHIIHNFLYLGLFYTHLHFMFIWGLCFELPSIEISIILVKKDKFLRNNLHLILYNYWKRMLNPFPLVCFAFIPPH